MSPELIPEDKSYRTKAIAGYPTISRKPRRFCEWPVIRPSEPETLNSSTLHG